MRFRPGFFLLWTSVCAHLASATPEPGPDPTAAAAPTPSPTPGGAPEPTSWGGPADTGVSSPGAATPPPEEGTGAVAVAVGVATEPPPARPRPRSQACLCDLTPDFCDINCCCDTADCNVTNLSSLFSGCPQKVLSGVCVDKWLMFRVNVDPALVTVTDSLLCINNKDDVPPSLPAVTRLPTLGSSYHFSAPAAMSSSHSRHFYRVDDVIQTYFSDSSVRGLLRQPSPGPVGTFCTNQNPAKFLRSGSFSCTRTVTPQSCTMDPNLNARSYFYNMSLVKTPVVEMTPEFLVTVTPQSDWPAPSQHNTSCLNVVKKVEFIIGYTGRGQLMYANVNVTLADVDPDQLLLQTHSVQFRLDTDAPPPERRNAPAGLRIGSPVLTLFDGKVLPLTTLGRSESGECLSDPSKRSPILFTFNTITGCTLRWLPGDCSELRSQIYTILEGLNTPDVMAMNFDSQPEWTRVISQRCPVSAEESCESGCVLPKALSIQVLWARQGPLDLPQNYILGAKYLFQCQRFQCPVVSPLILTTEVMFVETTRYPEPGRSTPQPKWKFPFGFFGRGLTELDGHVIMNGSEKVTWSLILCAVMSLTGLEFFT